MFYIHAIDLTEECVILVVSDHLHRSHHHNPLFRNFKSLGAVTYVVLPPAAVCRMQLI